MVALLREFPDVKLTFTLVPSLLVQLEAFAANQARDRTLALSLKPASQLTDEERRFILAHFFHAQRARMIEPYPRYAELLRRAEQAGETAARPRRCRRPIFATCRCGTNWRGSTRSGWMRDVARQGPAGPGPWLQRRGQAGPARGRARDPRPRRARIRRRAARGQIEIAASPFYHPILPLVCDTDIYLRTHPHSRMPRQRFRHPEDALAQLERAAVYHEQRFGRRPVGLWPSEGSGLRRDCAAGDASRLQWIATDEPSSARTLNTGVDPRRVRPSRAARGAVPALHHPGGRRGSRLPVPRPRPFRSDPDPHLRQLESGRRRCGFRGAPGRGGPPFSARTGGAEAVVPIILDGENAWDALRRSGAPLPSRVVRRRLGTSRAEDRDHERGGPGAVLALERHISGTSITRISVSIGHADDHRAWGQLADARQALEAPGPSATREGIVCAREELYIAEGSDWFW